LLRAPRPTWHRAPTSQLALPLLFLMRSSRPHNPRLRADYRFLEEVKLADDVAKRSKPPAPRPELPAHLQALVHQARRRGVQLHLLAPGMERRRSNTSRLDGRQQLLLWRVEWAFPAAQCRVANARVNDNLTLAQVLGPHLTPPPGSAMKTPELQEYADAGLGQLTVVMRKDLTPVRLAKCEARELQVVEASHTAP